jgi:hypothetical protein
LCAAGKNRIECVALDDISVHVFLALTITIK